MVDETVLTILHYLIGLDRYSARAISIFCAATFTWWGNRNLTFAEHAATGGAGELAREWFKFMLANGVGALVNYAAYSPAGRLRAGALVQSAARHRGRRRRRAGVQLHAVEAVRVPQRVRLRAGADRRCDRQANQYRAEPVHDRPLPRSAV